MLEILLTDLRRWVNNDISRFNVEIFERDESSLVLSNEVTVSVIKRVGKLFAWNVKQHVTLEAYQVECRVTANETSGLWHIRLGHVSTNKILQ